MPGDSAQSTSLPAVSRRTALKTVAGLAAAAGATGLLSACGSDTKSSTGTASNAATGPVTFGSNYSDPQPKAAFAALCTAAASKTSEKITINTADHNTFQNNISNYLQGTPDSLATCSPVTGCSSSPRRIC